MALELWFPDDVRHILAALASAGAGRGAEYQQALYDVGLAFGVVAQAEPRFRRTVEYHTGTPVEPVRFEVEYTVGPNSDTLTGF